MDRALIYFRIFIQNVIIYMQARPGWTHKKPVHLNEPRNKTTAVATELSCYLTGLLCILEW